MTHTPAYTKKYLQRRKFLLVLPLLVAPFLFFLFYSLGGGGSKVPAPIPGSFKGFNPELPKPAIHPKENEPNKLELYKQADADSLKRKEWLQQDPYHHKVFDTARQTEAPRADELLKRLDQLRASIRQQAPYPEQRPVFQRPPAQTAPPELGRLQQVLQSIKSTDTSEEDPQLQKLNTMLDKIICIQHPGETSPLATTAKPTTHSVSNEEMAADSSADNAMPAILPENQTLVTGATVALRLTDSSRIGAIRLPKDQLIYGVVSINDDRLLISIRSIRQDRSIYPTDLQVYDMDGLPGIHIPGTLNREVAKQSADQGISSLNLTTLDPSIGAQAANAGIQTAKTLFSRKVKLVRITVRAGYQVLLYREGRGNGQRRGGRQGRGDSLPSNRPPLNPPLEPFMNHHVSTEKITLTLQGIYLRENVLWFSLLLYNDGPIEFLPDYTRWTIRDRHQVKRTAIQDLPLSPVYATPMAILPGFSNRSWLIGFSPFALSRDKELVLQIGERNGARVLTMAIGHKELLKTKTL